MRVHDAEHAEAFVVLPQDAGGDGLHVRMKLNVRQARMPLSARGKRRQDERFQFFADAKDGPAEFFFAARRLAMTFEIVEQRIEDAIGKYDALKRPVGFGCGRRRFDRRGAIRANPTAPACEHRPCQRQQIRERSSHPPCSSQSAAISAVSHSKSFLLVGIGVDERSLGNLVGENSRFSCFFHDMISRFAH